MWSNDYIAILLIVLLIAAWWLFELYVRVNKSPNTIKSMYDELMFNSVSIVSIFEDLMKWRNKLTTLQERSGKIAIVTGGARGIGLELTKGLLKYGMNVTIGVRQVEKYKELIEDLKKEFPNGKITALKLDLSSLKSVKKFANEVSNKHKTIHILVNNAGILKSDYKITEDGFEDKLATNYLGHFLLTHLLLENLKRGGASEKNYSRIVNVSSISHYGAQIFFDDINMEKYYIPVAAYTQSKLAQLMSNHHINAMMISEEIPIRSYSVHPGLVASDMFDDNTKNVTKLLKYLIKDKAQGAVVVLYACLSADLEGKSEQKMYSNCREGLSSEYSQNKQNQKRLFDMTLDMLKINNFGVKRVILFSIVSSGSGKFRGRTRDI